MKQILFIYRPIAASKKLIYFYRKVSFVGLAFILLGIISCTVVSDTNSYAADNQFGYDVSGASGNSEAAEKEKKVFPNYNQGLEYLNQGEYEKAIVSFEKALKHKENVLDSHYRLANIYQLIKNDSEKARRHFDAYIAILTSLNDSDKLNGQNFGNQRDENLKQSKKLFEESLILAGSNKIDEAKEKLQKAVELNPNDPVMLYNLGVMEHKLGKLDEAVKNYLKSIDLRIINDSVYLSLAIAYQQKGDNLSAVDAYQKALDFSPSNIVALNNLAVLLEQAGMLDDAIERYNQIIELEPFYMRAYNNLASIYARRKQYDKAKKYLEQAIEIDPSYLDPHYNLGMIYEKSGNFSKALEEFRFVFLNNSEYPDVSDKIVKLEAVKSEGNKNIVQTNQVGSVARYKRFKRPELSSSGQLAGNKAGSQNIENFEVDYKHLKQELRKNPLSYKANKDIIEFLRAHKMYDKALVFADNAREKLKGNPEMLVLSADTAADKKYFYRAIKEYEEILKSYPKMNEVHYKLSLIYVDKNNPLKDSRKALVHYKKYMKAKEAVSSSQTK
ncbi:tetratricopeptide repeat protein [bacterium]|nr:tetratricopeptide repeat protein [bacterium]